MPKRPSSSPIEPLSWVTPTCANSDHAGCGAKTGPAWVASLVNAIGESQYWNNTAIFIFWDDYGGWYDPAAPKKLDYDGLGMRIPMLIVSADSDHTVPWAIANAAYKKQERNKGVTEIVKMPGRGHSLTIDAGWREVAEKALEFVRRFASRPVDRS